MGGARGGLFTLQLGVSASLSLVCSGQVAQNAWEALEAMAKLQVRAGGTGFGREPRAGVPCVRSNPQPQGGKHPSFHQL